MPSKIAWNQVGQPSNAILSPAFVTSNAPLVFTSGCLGTDAEGKFASGVVAQTELACANLVRVLEASGSSPEKILKVLLFVADGKDAPEVNKVYQRWFPGQPARLCIVVAFPNKDVLVEMECVAEGGLGGKL